MVEIPLIGFGTYNIPRKMTEDRVRTAIEIGYRLIDTAQMYGNEKEVGAAVRGCGLKREDIFVQTKISSPCLSYQSAVDSFRRSLEAMRLDYVDMMLIHWPQGGEAVTWEALEDMQKEGLARHIGVSNFYPRQWEKLCAHARVKPCVNQVEVNVFYQQHPMGEYMKRHECLMQAWQPLGEGARKILSNGTLQDIGRVHGKTAAQVALRYLTQQGVSVIPRSTNPEHIRENFQIFDFTLTQEELRRIRMLDEGRSQYGWPEDAWRYEPAKEQ